MTEKEMTIKTTVPIRSSLTLSVPSSLRHGFGLTLISGTSQQTQFNICITCIQRRPTLYKCHTNVLPLLECVLLYKVTGYLTIIHNYWTCQHGLLILQNGPAYDKIVKPKFVNNIVQNLATQGLVLLGYFSHILKKLIFQLYQCHGLIAGDSLYVTVFNCGQFRGSV